jgi:hypothetical protein
MAFKPGNKLSLGKGRPVDSKNRKITIQERATEFLLGNFEDLQREYRRDMSVGQKIKLFEVLLPFASPKLQATATMTAYDRLSEADAKRLVDQLKQRVLESDQIQDFEALQIIPNE